MKISRRTLIVCAVSALVVSAVAVAATQARAAKPETKPATPIAAAVQLAEVKQVQTVSREEVTGALQPAKELKVGFEVPGRLERIVATKGSFLVEGAVIARLDPELADAQVQQAEAALKAAEAQSAIAADTARRQAELRQKGTVSEFQSQSAQSQSAGASAQVQAAKAQLTQARANRRRHELRAPFAGTLIDAPDQVGATVGAGMTLFTLEQLDPLVLKITVPESARSSVRIGSRVRVEAVGGGVQSEDAMVRAVIPSADANTRRIPVEIVVPNQDGRFTAHTLARAVLPLGAPEAALSLPASALASGGGDHVYTLGDAGEIRRVPVQVVERGAQVVVVKSREPLARVVDYPASDLSEDTKVSVR